MQKNIVKLFLCVNIFFLSLSANANISLLNSIINGLERREAAYMAMVNSMGSAFNLSNVMLLAQNRDALYCPPGSLQLGGENYRAMVLREWSARKDFYSQGGFASDPLFAVSFMLFNSLKDNFPCKN